MLFLAALAVTLQGKSLMAQIVPHPTGRNGYEEYLQAADLLSSVEESVYARWTPGSTAQPRESYSPNNGLPSRDEISLYNHLKNFSSLDTRREELSRYEQALRLIAQGNGKPVYDPRASSGPETLFPESIGFKYVALFAVRAASVYAADGQTDRATDILLDGLSFADNFGRGLIIANLVDAACASIDLAAFDELLPRLSRLDALKIQKAVDVLLARPIAARSVLPTEIALMKPTLAATVGAPEKDLADLLSTSGNDTPDSKARAAAKQVVSLSLEGRSALLHEIAARFDGVVHRVDRVLEGPERDWHAGVAAAQEDEDAGPFDLAEAFVTAFSVNETGFVDVAVRQRTQLRLLALHAKLIQHRWDYGRYPSSLNDIDPLTGEHYEYEVRKDGTVRLASKGIPTTGEIELRYRRTTIGDQEVQP